MLRARLLLTAILPPGVGCRLSLVISVSANSWTDSMAVTFRWRRSNRQRFDARRRGRRNSYDAETLKRYVDADLAIIRQAQPDLIIGDFRLSLSVSARLAGVPYATISMRIGVPL